MSKIKIIITQISSKTNFFYIFCVTRVIESNMLPIKMPKLSCDTIHKNPKIYKSEQIIAHLVKSLKLTKNKIFYDYKNIGQALYGIACLNIFQSNIEDSANFFLRAVKVYESLDIIDKEYFFILKMASSFLFNLNRHEKGLELLIKKYKAGINLEMINSKEYPPLNKFIFETINEMAISFISKKEYDKAINLYNITLITLLEINKDPLYQAAVLINTGYILWDNNRMLIYDNKMLKLEKDNFIKGLEILYS